MSVLLILSLGCAGLLVLYLSDRLSARPSAAAWLVLGLVVGDALVMAEAVSVHIAGFRVDPTDVGFGLLLLAAVMRLVRFPPASPPQVWLAVLASMAFLSLFMGVLARPIGEVVNMFRPYLAYLAAALYFSTTRPAADLRQAIGRAWLFAGIGIAALVAVRWLARLTGADLGVFDDTFDRAIRVLDGPDSMFVATSAMVLLLSALDRESGRGGERVVGAVLLVMAVALNRRTVWIALVAVSIVLLVRNRRIGLRLAALASLGLVLFTLASPAFLGSDSGSGAFRPADDLGTLAWRVEGWAGLLESGPDNPADLVLGRPFGTGFSRVVDGRELESNPHSFYLQTFLTTGLVGVGSLCLVLWLCLAALRRRSPKEAGPLTREHLLLLLVMQAVWFLAWPPGAEQGLILGMAVAAAGWQQVSTSTDATAEVRKVGLWR